MPGCRARQIHDREFTREEIEEAARSARLLAMEIELGRGGSSRCHHALAPERASSGNQLSQEEARDVILQAADLGARRISILGAEPTRYRCISELARFMRSQDLEVEMFASGVGMTSDFASDLFENRVSVVLRMDSLDESRQDMLTGAKGSFKLIQETFRALREAGYPSDEAVLRVDALICRHNIDEAVTLWRWLRDRNVVPRFSIAAPQASAEAGGGTDVDLAGIQQVFAEIAEIERDEYGSAWDPSPRSWGNGCMRHKFSCLVRWQGDVVPCVGLRIPIGNIREQKLRDIIEDSEVLEDLRNHTSTMKGPCASCEESDICYGCRGAAYQATGDYLASDPFCWRNAERQDEIARLPIAAAELIPHEPPMRVVDDLVGTGERSGEVSVRVSEEMPFVGEDGAVRSTGIGTGRRHIERFRLQGDPVRTIRCRKGERFAKRYGACPRRDQDLAGRGRCLRTCRLGRMSVTPWTPSHLRIAESSDSTLIDISTPMLVALGAWKPNSPLLGRVQQPAGSLR
jgi:radical SAM protein with 4Fe4S-binding SPASM domain